MNANKCIFCLFIACLMITWASILMGEGQKSRRDINWQVISNGSTEGTSTNYGLKGTVSQTAVGYGASTSYKLRPGFWQIFSSGTEPCQGRCGDCNTDSSLDISDAVHIINFVFIGGGEPQPVLACGDANGDASVDISDAVHIINFVFIGGSQPGTCSPGGPNWYNGNCCPF